MDDRTARGVRDGLFALVALSGLLDHLRRRNRLGVLRLPGPALVGSLGAVILETVLLRHPERTEALWGRRYVRFGSLVGTLLLGRCLPRGSAPRTAAALCWGLVTYLAMLGFVLAGRPNPVSLLPMIPGGRESSGGQS